MLRRQASSLSPLAVCVWRGARTLAWGGIAFKTEPAGKSKFVLVSSLPTRREVKKESASATASTVDTRNRYTGLGDEESSDDVPMGSSTVKRSLSPAGADDQTAHAASAASSRASSPGGNAKAHQAGGKAPGAHASKNKRRRANAKANAAKTAALVVAERITGAQTMLLTRRPNEDDDLY